MTKDKNNDNDFFVEASILQARAFNVVKEERFMHENALELLSRLLLQEETYQVMARLSFAVLFGWYKNGELIFSQPIVIADADVEEIRAFNDLQEVLLQRRDDTYWVRSITDKTGDTIKAVDSTSCLFGAVTGATVPDGFAELYEPGRKINMVIPVNDARKGDVYTITTRSYITYDEITGQAGYGYSRYLKIRKERRNE